MHQAPSEYQRCFSLCREVPVLIAFSQECAKASFPDICSIPIQVNKARQIIGVSFDLNDSVVKIGRVSNARRNARFRAAIVKRINNVLPDYL
jgi:hypothetical protein